MSTNDLSGRRADGNRQQRRARAAQSRSKPRIVYQSPGINPSIAEAAMKHSAALDIVVADDKAWFEANPERTLRLRPAASAEIAFHGCCGLSEHSGSNNYTLVKQLEPGSRVRMPFRTYIIHRPEHYGENACEMLFRELEEEHPNIAQAIKATASLARRGA